MLNGFDGTARNRPRVNLGGKKKELTREELLLKAASDRKQREQLRQEQAAATLIQRCWQARKARTLASNLLRHDFDELCLAIEQRKENAGGVLDTPIDALRLVSRLYLYFFSPKHDLERTNRILDLTCQFAHMPLAGENARLAVRLIKPLVRTGLVQMYDQNHDVNAVVMIRQFVGLPEAREYFCNLDESYSYYDFLAKYLRMRMNSASLTCACSEVRDEAFYDCVTLPLKHGESSKAGQGLSQHILPLENLFLHPGLVKSLVDIGLDGLSSLVTLHNDTLHDQLGGSSVLGSSNSVQRFIHFIRLTTDEIRHASVSAKDAWIIAVCGLCRLVALPKSPAGHRECQDDTDKLLKDLIRPQLMHDLLAPMAPKRLPDYVCQVTARSTRIKEQMYLTLSLFATSTDSPYNLLNTAYQWWVLDQPQKVHKKRFTPRIVFYLDLLSRILLTMVDDEFFDAKKRPFDLVMIQDTASLLKECAYILFMVDGRQPDRHNTSATLEHEALKDLVARLLQQIQIRDSRRQFLPKDFWLYTEKFDMRNFSNQVAAEAWQPIEDDTDRMDIEDEINPETENERKVAQRWRTPPRVQIINNCPFFFPFATRIEILQTVIDMDVHENGFDDFFNRTTRQHVTCRRDHEFEDGFEALWKVGSGIKGPLSVDYRDVHGLAEAGIDGGGLTKEFLTAVCRQAFHPDFSMFVETPERLLYPNPTLIARSPKYLQYYEFLGRIIAKCIYEDILVDVAFAPFFLLNWIGKLAYIDDLQALDKDLYNGLIQLKNYPGDVENDLSLDFTVNEEVGEDGLQRTINLIPAGAQTAVTRMNRLRYIHLVCNFKLNTRIAKQSQAFVKGMSDVLDLRWLAIFNQTEMQALVGGAPVPIDVDELRANTVYGGFDESDATVRIFWDVLREFDNEERRQLVKFVTSTPRPPLLGFKDLVPKFSLRHAGSDVERLPTASTCVNLLKLPAYTTHEQMRRKLRLSITAGAGFDLS